MRTSPAAAHEYNPAALDAYVAQMARFNASVATLQTLADDHFGHDVEAIDWSHVGSLTYINKQLAELLEFAGIDMAQWKEAGRIADAINADLAKPADSRVRTMFDPAALMSLTPGTPEHAALVEKLEARHPLRPRSDDAERAAQNRAADAAETARLDLHWSDESECHCIVCKQPVDACACIAPPCPGCEVCCVVCK